MKVSVFEVQGLGANARERVPALVAKFHPDEYLSEVLGLNENYDTSRS